MTDAQRVDLRSRPEVRRDLILGFSALVAGLLLNTAIDDLLTPLLALHLPPHVAFYIGGTLTACVVAAVGVYVGWNGTGLILTRKALKAQDDVSSPGDSLRNGLKRHPLRTPYRFCAVAAVLFSAGLALGVWRSLGGLLMIGAIFLGCLLRSAKSGGHPRFTFLKNGSLKA